MGSTKQRKAFCVNAEEYRAAVKEFEELWAGDTSPLNQNRMDDLILVIRAYEHDS